jgi:hypothetical protein
MSMVDALPRKPSLDFRGTGLQCLGYGLLYLVLSMTIVGIPWGISVISKWFVENLTLDDGTRPRWLGRATELLLPFLALLVGVGVYGAAFASQASQREPNIAIILVPALVLYLGIVPWFSVTVLRWFFRGIGLSSGQSLSFRGSMLGYLGWMLLYMLSIYTVVGWAWASTAWLRWVFRNLDVSDGSRVRFVGGGFELLWRGIVVGLGSIFVITYPWLLVWLMKWVVRNVEVDRAAAPGTAF